MPDKPAIPGIQAAAPFWISLAFPVISYMAATRGDIWTWIYVASGFLGVSLLDAVFGLEDGNPDPEAKDHLFWHKLITWIWLPIQTVMVFSIIWWIQYAELDFGHALGLAIGLGITSGGIGIVYGHELIHQQSRTERALGEALMISVLYGHFVTEHLVIHHRYVATPKDAATARYNESFYAFALRVLPQSLVSAWQVERARLNRRNLPVWYFSNPFWRYIGGAVLVLFVAFMLGGAMGVFFFVVQALVAVLLLEQINYIEHYGLLRKRLSDGKYEQVQPHHSWNATHKVSNFVLINLQRHSDHHMKPARRFPYLQTYTENMAPVLPFSYPMMTLLALNPFLWRRVMNPRVRRWRALHYPEITDWSTP